MIYNIDLDNDTAMKLAGSLDADEIIASAQNYLNAIAHGNNDEQPSLGLATTGELLAELTARAEIGGYATYRTVDSCD